MTGKYKREIRGMLAIWLAGSAVAFGVFSPITARAAVLPAPALPVAVPSVDPNPCGVAGWYVNPDEADREPTRTYDGFVFESADLIHHAAPAGLTTATLSPGHFLVAAGSSLPDQPSFFSVEVSGDDGGYATLRYNRITLKWDMVTGGQFYSNADPSALVDMPPVKRSHKVVSFGVGYTANPPGTVKTTVKSVSFQGKAYSFACPKPSPTQSPTASPTPSTSTSPTASASPSVSSVSPSATSTSVSPSATASATTSPSTSLIPVPSDAGTDGELPTTGASLGGLLAVGLGVLLFGGLITWWFRRGRTGSSAH
jgi:hypothetical protein